jgi:hypothetical protein
LADIEESEVQTGNKKLLYPNFPANGSEELCVLNPDPYKVTVAAPMMGTFRGDEEDTSTPRSVKIKPTD